MFHAHGWVEISTSTYEEDFEEVRQAVARVETEMGRRALQGVHLDANGGAYVLLVNLVRNRELGFKGELWQLLVVVGEIAPGSHGIVYLRDSDFDDEFTVDVVKRGRVSLGSDPFLSPAVPEIEDP
jgi:hypothetical protein